MSSAFDQVGKFYTKQLDTHLLLRRWQLRAGRRLRPALQTMRLENSRRLTEKLAGAKDLQETVKLQSEFFKTAYEDFVAHTTKIGNLYSDLAKEASKQLQERRLDRSPAEREQRFARSARHAQHFLPAALAGCNASCTIPRPFQDTRRAVRLLENIGRQVRE